MCVCFMSFSVLFVCICVLYYCHRVANQLQLNISYHIISNQLTSVDLQNVMSLSDEEYFIELLQFHFQNGIYSAAYTTTDFKN